MEHLLLREEGGVRPSDAARVLRLPRPTAHRLLETLEELGYVRRCASDSRFCVTIKARRLSGGYDIDVQLSEVVGPILSQLLVEVQLVPDLPEVTPMRLRMAEIDNVPLLSFRESPYFGWQSAAKRAMARYGHWA